VQGVEQERFTVAATADSAWVPLETGCCLIEDGALLLEYLLGAPRPDQLFQLSCAEAVPADLSVRCTQALTAV